MNKQDSKNEVEEIVLVNSKDRVIGVEEKLKVHEKGMLHRAFSILIFDSKGKLLIQQRAKNKYHSPGLWANTCCSHQRQGELLGEAIHRRLMEEVGFDCELKEIFKFHYFIKFDNGLIENEIDHVFLGFYEGEIRPNPKEIDNIKWQKLEEIKRDINVRPSNYAYWFKEIINRNNQISLRLISDQRPLQESNLSTL